MKKNRSGVISKATRIIQAFVDDNHEWGVRDLAKYLSMPVATVHRLIYQLQDENIISFDEQKNKYTIGTELIRLSTRVSNQTDIKKVTAPYLYKLVEKHKETVCLVLYIKEKQKMIWFDKVNGPEPLQYIISMGELQPLPYGSSVKSIMAYLDEAEVIEICKKENFSDNDIEKIKKELSQIQEERVFTTRSERLEGSRGIASAIIGADQRPVGSIVFTAPISRVEDKDIEAIKKDIKEAAEEVSTILGAK